MTFSILYRMTTISNKKVVFHAEINAKTEEEARELFEMAEPKGRIVEIEVKK
jgi:hypothetical protein